MSTRRYALIEEALFAPSTSTVRSAFTLDLIPGAVWVLKGNTFTRKNREDFRNVVLMRSTYLQLEILLLSHLCSRSDCTSPSDTTTNRPSCLPVRTTLIPLTATWPGNTWISSMTTGLTPWRVSAERPFTALMIFPLSAN